MSKTINIGVIIPVYNEALGLEANLATIDDRLLRDGFQPSYMLVDDGSSDGTWQVINTLKSQYGERLKAIRFAKNFGKEVALSAGVDYLDAELYATLDADLQHPPAAIKGMVDLLNSEHCDIVSGVKSDRGAESGLHRFIANSYYRTLNMLTHLDMQNSSDLKVFRRPVALALRQFHERHIFFRGIVSWVGFTHRNYPFKVASRQAGHTSFSTFKLFKLALDAIVSYTSKPLYIVVIGGVVFALFAVVMALQTLYNYFNGTALNGFSTVILILLIMGSLIMTSLGIIGIYISRIYKEIKARPRYIVKDDV